MDASTIANQIEKTGATQQNAHCAIENYHLFCYTAARRFCIYKLIGTFFGLESTFWWRECDWFRCVVNRENFKCVHVSNENNQIFLINFKLFLEFSFDYWNSVTFIYFIIVEIFISYFWKKNNWIKKFYYWN